MRRIVFASLRLQWREHPWRLCGSSSLWRLRVASRVASRDDSAQLTETITPSLLWRCSLRSQRAYVSKAEKFLDLPMSWWKTLPQNLKQ